MIKVRPNMHRMGGCCFSCKLEVFLKYVGSVGFATGTVHMQNIKMSQLNAKGVT